MTSILLWLVTYDVYNVDHLTQVPMLMKKLSPNLFPTDWFFQGNGQYMVRKNYMDLQLLLLRFIPQINLILFLQYVCLRALTVVALWWTCRRLNRTLWHAAAWIFILGTMNEYAPFASATLFDRLMVPRIYAYTACLLAVPMILRGWYAAAGLIMGLAGLLQAAPSFQFLPVAIIWIISMLGWRKGGMKSLAVVLAFFAGYWPQIALGKQLLDSSIYPPAQSIHWLAFIRHPHHMLPLHFDPQEYYELFAPLLLVWVRMRKGMINDSSRQMLRLVAATIAFLLVSVVFIYAIPLSGWIAFQPMRMGTMLRFYLFFFLMEHWIWLARTRPPYAILRAVLLFIAIAVTPWHTPPVFTAMVLESIFLVLEPKLSPALYRKVIAISLWLSMLVYLVADELRAVVMLVLCTAFLLPRLQLERRALGWMQWRPSRPLVYSTLIILNACFWGCLLLWKFDAPLDQSPRKYTAWQRAKYEFCRKYTVYPFPQAALELAGVWAKEHTPQDALFMIPPGRDKESFQIWSHRSIVFNVKMFPFTQGEWPQWIERYYAMGGVSDPQRQAADAQLLYDSPGGEFVDDMYAVLSADQLINIAHRYHAGYVVSSCEALTHSPKLKIAAGPFYSLRDRRNKRGPRHPLWIFSVPQPQ